MNRATKIKVGDDSLDGITVKHGVPQGGSLSPILYSIYLNDTPTAQQTQSFCGQYGLLDIFKTLKSKIQNLRQIAKIFSQWYRIWKLHHSKTKVAVPKINWVPNLLEDVLKINKIKTQFINFYSNEYGIVKDKKENNQNQQHTHIKPSKTSKCFGFTLE